MNPPVFPVVPSTLRPDTFAQEMDDFLAFMPGFRDWMVSVAGNLLLSLSGTSASALAISLGAKSLSVQPGLGLQAGMDVVVALTADATKRMICLVTGYNASTGALSLDAYTVFGSGSYSAWTITPTAAVIGLLTESDPQTVTNKDISADQNTIGGLAASSFVVTTAVGALDGAAAQKAIPAGAVVGTTDTQTLSKKTLVGHKEMHVAVASSTIDLDAGNSFSKTISGVTTFSLANIPATGTFCGFVLELTNGGSATVNLWSGIKWAAGTAPTLTTSGVDLLGFSTRDGGTTWRGYLLAKDSK